MADKTDFHWVRIVSDDHEKHVKTIKNAYELYDDNIKLIEAPLVFTDEYSHGSYKDKDMNTITKAKCSFISDSPSGTLVANKNAMIRDLSYTTQNELHFVKETHTSIGNTYYENKTVIGDYDTSPESYSAYRLVQYKFPIGTFNYSYKFTTRGSYEYGSTHGLRTFLSKFDDAEPFMKGHNLICFSFIVSTTESFDDDIRFKLAVSPMDKQSRYKSGLSKEQLFQYLKGEFTYEISFELRASFRELYLESIDCSLPANNSFPKNIEIVKKLCRFIPLPNNQYRLNYVFAMQRNDNAKESMNDLFLNFYLDDQKSEYMGKDILNIHKSQLHIGCLPVYDRVRVDEDYLPKNYADYYQEALYNDEHHNILIEMPYSIAKVKSKLSNFFFSFNLESTFCPNNTYLHSYPINQREYLEFGQEFPLVRQNAIYFEEEKIITKDTKFLGIKNDIFLNIGGVVFVENSGNVFNYFSRNTSDVDELLADNSKGKVLTYAKYVTVPHRANPDSSGIYNHSIVIQFIDKGTHIEMLGSVNGHIANLKSFFVPKIINNKIEFLATKCPYRISNFKLYKGVYGEFRND